MALTLAVRAELEKLARTLGTGPAELDFLEGETVPTLRALREEATERLFSSHTGLFERVAAMSGIMPAGINAKIAEVAFGPLICARVAGALPPARAVEVSSHLSTPFLVEVTLLLDPRRAREVIAATPAARLMEISRALAARGEFVTMGRFVDYISDDTIRRIMDELSDEQLLRIGFYIENKARLSAIVAQMPDARLMRVNRVAASPGLNLWAEALAMMADADAALQTRMAGLATDLAPNELAGLVTVATRDQLWGTVLPVVAALTPVQRARVMELPPLAESEHAAAVLRAAAGADLWEAALALLADAPPATRAALARATDTLSNHELKNLMAAVARRPAWSLLNGLLAELPRDVARRAATVLAGLDDATLDAALAEVDYRAHWPTLLALAPTLDAPVRDRYARNGRQWMDGVLRGDDRSS